jgi:hypothetical protein
MRRVSIVAMKTNETATSIRFFSKRRTLESFGFVFADFSFQISQSQKTPRWSSKSSLESRIYTIDVTLISYHGW